MYLASNSHPDIAFDVNHCARFKNLPCQSHAKVVKRILHNIKGTEIKGLILEHYQNLQVDCYVDADFSGI